MKLINKNYVKYLLSKPRNSIKCHSMREVKKLINIIKSSDRANMSYIHPLERYKEEIEKDGYVEIFLYCNKKVWIQGSIFGNVIVFNNNPLY